MRIVFFICLILVVSNLDAQTTINPNTVEFSASPDHNATVPGSNPVVPVLDHYELNTMIGNASGALSWTEQLGKPTPDAANKISVSVPKFSTLARGSYVVTVSSVGSGSSPIINTSVASDPFSATGPIAASGKPVLSRK